MKNKNIILTILGVIIIVISGIGISYFIYQNNLKNPINESYETNNENTNETNNENTNETNNENIDVYIKNHIISDGLIITDKGYHDGVNNSKIYANDEEIFEGNTMTIISKVIKLNDEDFILQFAEISEGTSEGSYLFYNKGKSYIDLNEKTQLDIARVLEVNGNEITLVSSKLYLYLSVLCSMGYNDEDII